LAGQRDKVIVSCGFPTKNTRFLLDKPQIKIENPGKKNKTIKKKYHKKISFKLLQKKRLWQLPTHPQTSE